MPAQIDDLIVAHVLSCRLDARQEAFDFTPQHLGLLSQFAGGAQDLTGRGAGLLRRMGNLGDILRDLTRPGGGLGDVSGYFGGRGALLLDRRRDRGGAVVDFADGDADTLDGFDGHPFVASCIALIWAEISPVALLVRLAKSSPLATDRETLTGLTGPCRFDRGVQRQKVGLAGDEEIRSTTVR